MARTRYTPEEILQHLRTVELDTGTGLAVFDACRKLGITERWRIHYNTVRPHSTLGGQPPAPETLQLAS